MESLDTLPSFTASDQDGNEFSSQQLIGKPAVIYFYPKDDTPGCTREACGFRDSYEDFAEAGAVIVGISGDGPESHRAFKQKHRLPFTLLSDPDGELRRLFGVAEGAFGLWAGRETFVYNAKGKLIYRFRSQFSPRQHVRRALKAIKSANAEND
ncbi:MAG: peroxiredoxin [Salibacteraceae bacterium]